MPDERIYKINSGLPLTTKIELLNDMIIAINGKIEQGKFDLNELNSLYDDNSGWTRHFARNTALGHTVGTYTGWTHHYAFSGYSIWKYAPTAFITNSVNQLYFDDKVLEYMGEVTSGNSIVNLLTLTSANFLKENYVWCDDGTYVYVTIKNTGVSDYEGDAFITSASSSANKQAFFVSNHEFKMDYQNAL